MTTPTTEQIEAEAAKAIVSEAFLLCQPNHGDVFSWIDEHATALAKAALSATPAPPSAETGCECGHIYWADPDCPKCCGTGRAPPPESLAWDEPRPGETQADVIRRVCGNPIEGVSAMAAPSPESGGVEERLRKAAEGHLTGQLAKDILAALAALAEARRKAERGPSREPSEAVLAEREACAQIADELSLEICCDCFSGSTIADAIRNRSATKAEG